MRSRTAKAWPSQKTVAWVASGLVTIVSQSSPGVRLDPKSRARLAEKLLASLDDLSEGENAAIWAEEAARRNAAWDHAAGEGLSADEVFREARARVE